MRNSILERMKITFDNLIYLVIWLVLAIGITFIIIQVHSTLIAVALVVVDTPAVRPPGWNTATIYGLSRLLWLILGIFWLGWVMFTEGYLREGRDFHCLKPRSIRLGAMIGVTYLVCIFILLLL